MILGILDLYLLREGMRFKVVFIGDGKVGKSAYIQRYLDGEFSDSYVATLGVDVHTLTFNTNYGPVTLDIWDTAGQEKFGGLGDGYYIEADGAIIFYDVTSMDSFYEVHKWLQSFRSVTGNGTSVILCGNKSDLKDASDASDASDVPDASEVYGLTSCEVSVKNNHNCDQPMLELMRQLTSYSDLVVKEH